MVVWTLPTTSKLFFILWDKVTNLFYSSHMAYPLDGAEGYNCPASHSIKFPTMFLECVAINTAFSGLN